MSLTTPLGSIADLTSVWGREALGFERWPLLREGLPRHEELLDVLERAPTGALEYLESPETPGECMLPLELPPEREALLEATATRPVVLRAGNLSAWLPGASTWCRAWATALARSLGGASEALADVRAEVYVAGPRALTVFHADPSHNFCLQELGDRELHIHANDDPRLVNAESRAGIYLYRGIFPRYREDCGDREHTFALRAGRAAYLPPLAGHWIRNGPSRSVSFVVSVRTRAEEREKLVHRFNARLRARGLSTRAFGCSAWRDSLKATGERALARARACVAPAREARALHDLPERL